MAHETQVSPHASTQPDQAQVDAWLSAARVLKTERPELFGKADGALATLVLPDGQGAAIGIQPGMCWSPMGIRRWIQRSGLSPSPLKLLRRRA